MDILPVEIWDPPSPGLQASAHLQAYLCPVVKAGLELLLSPAGLKLDGLLFPHLCDSLQNLGSLCAHLLDPPAPVYHFYAPKALDCRSARDYYRECLEDLVLKLARDGVALEPEELRQRAAQARTIAGRLQTLYELRQNRAIRASNTQFYHCIRLLEYLHPDDYLPHLENFQLTTQGPGAPGPGVVLSGILPNPAEVLELLDELGLRVVQDDLINCGRRLAPPPPTSGDVFTDMVEAYFRRPPCSTNATALEARIQHLLNLVKAARASGVIFWHLKFCEPEAFDLPMLRAALKSAGIPSMVMETDLNQGLGGQLATRLEAFTEMLGHEE